VSQTVGLSTWDYARFDEAYYDYNIQNLASLELVVQRFTYTPDKLTVYASTMPVDMNKRLEEINRNLEALQAQYNPSTPS
jgi:hypothetical protein